MKNHICNHQCQKCIDEYLEYMDSKQEDPQLKAEREYTEFLEYMNSLTNNNTNN